MTEVAPLPAAAPFALDTARAAIRRRVTPYAIGGMILGGVLGYIYDGQANVPSDEDMGLGTVIYPMMGASMGLVAGLGVGYLFESWPARSPRPEAF